MSRDLVETLKMSSNRKADAPGMRMIETLSRDETVQAVCLLAIGAARAVRQNPRLWPPAERFVFNGKVFFHCLRSLRHRGLADIVDGGMQIEDTWDVLGKDADIEEQCREVEEAAMRILGRAARSARS